MIVCPNCGANVKYSADKKKMFCEFCETEFDPNEFEDEVGGAETHEVSADQVTQTEDDSMEVTVYTCPQCGGELMSVDNNTAAAFCSFCGASTVLTSRLRKERKPDYIIPFEITKEQCKEAYLKVVSKSKFAPDDIKDKDCIESFRGIYMPYWSYNIIQKGPFFLKGNVSHKEGNYMVTNHYQLSGDVDASYDGLSFDASSAFSDNISQKLGPFDVKKRIDFNPSYMSGFYADLADVSKDVYSDDAKSIAENMSFNEANNQFGGYSIEKNPNNNNSTFHSRISKADATMFPVWFMSYRKGDRVSYATVNGLTGKVVADIPIDTKKYLKISGIIAAIIFVILNFILTMTPIAVSVFSAFLMIVVIIINLSQRKEIEKRDAEVGDKGKLYVMKGRTEREKRSMSVMEASVIAISVVLCILTFLVVQMEVVSDIPYYLLCVIDAVCFAFNFKYTLDNYNVLSTRKLPQFNREGGDDRA